MNRELNWGTDPMRWVPGHLANTADWVPFLWSPFIALLEPCMSNTRNQKGIALLQIQLCWRKISIELPQTFAKNDSIPSTIPHRFPEEQKLFNLILIDFWLFHTKILTSWDADATSSAWGLLDHSFKLWSLFVPHFFWKSLPCISVKGKLKSCEVWYAVFYRIFRSYRRNDDVTVISVVSKTNLHINRSVFTAALHIWCMK